MRVIWTQILWHWYTSLITILFFFFWTCNKALWYGFMFVWIIYFGIKLIIPLIRSFREEFFYIFCVIVVFITAFYLEAVMMVLCVSNSFSKLLHALFVSLNPYNSFRFNNFDHCYLLIWGCEVCFFFFLIGTSWCV